MRQQRVKWFVPFGVSVALSRIQMSPVVASIFLLCGTITYSNANDREAQQAVLEDRSYYGAMFETGYLTAVRNSSEGSDVRRYDHAGNIIWERLFNNQEVIAADEWGSSTYMILFDRLDTSGKRYMDGEYTLEVCKPDRDCETLRTFPAGARDIALSAEGVWVLEHTLSEIDYTWAYPPIPPPLSQANLYSRSGDLLSSHEQNGAISIDHDSENLYVELFSREKSGIYKVTKSGDERVGGLRPYENFGDLFHFLCNDFLYLADLELTICLRPYDHVAEGRTYYSIWLIGRDSRMLKLDSVKLKPSHGAGMDRIKKAGASLLRRED